MNHGVDASIYGARDRRSFRSMFEFPLTETFYGVAAGLVAVLVTRYSAPRRLDVVGTYAVFASMAMLALDRAASWTVFALVGALFVVESEWCVRRMPPTGRAATIAGFLALVGLGITGGASLELRISALGAAAALTVGVAELRTHEPAILAALATISAAGIYVNVPDTEHITLVGAGLGVLTIAFALGPPRVARGLGLVGVAFAVTVLLSAAAVDARGRPSAFIGVVGALGVFLAEPIAQRLRRGRPVHALVLIAVHAAVAITIGRLATDLDTGRLLAATAAGLAAVTILLALSPRRRTTGRRPPRRWRPAGPRSPEPR